MSCYKGKIKNSGSQEVKAIYGNKSSEKPVAKVGEDLRNEKTVKK